MAERADRKRAPGGAVGILVSTAVMLLLAGHPAAAQSRKELREELAASREHATRLEEALDAAAAQTATLESQLERLRQELAEQPVPVRPPLGWTPPPAAAPAPIANAKNPPPPTAIVRAQPCLNLRDAPLDDARKLDCVDAGSEVEILDRRPEWSRVLLASGREGWVLTRFLEPPSRRLERPTPAAGEEPLFAALTERLEAAENANAELSAALEVSRRQREELAARLSRSAQRLPTPEVSPASPAPAAAAPPDTGATPAAARASVTAWAAAWSRQDVDSYLEHYAASFRPPPGMSRLDWEGERRRRILGPAWIEVSLEELELQPLYADRLRAFFTQGYRSDRFQDRVQKQLDLVWEAGAWKIQSEATDG